MPLTIFPVPFLSDPNPKDKEQKPIVPPPSTRRAVTLKLPIEVARALKDASANAKPGGQPAVRVTLSGDKPVSSLCRFRFPFRSGLPRHPDSENANIIPCSLPHRDLQFRASFSLSICR